MSAIPAALPAVNVPPHPPELGRRYADRASGSATCCTVIVSTAGACPH
jgi:hypothetical protein